MTESGFYFWTVLKVIFFAGLVIWLAFPPLVRLEKEMKRKGIR